WQAGLHYPARPGHAREAWHPDDGRDGRTDGSRSPHVLVQQQLAVIQDVPQNVVGAVRVVNEEPILPELVIHCEALALVSEVNPGFGNPIGYESRHLSSG